MTGLGQLREITFTKLNVAMGLHAFTGTINLMWPVVGRAEQILDKQEAKQYARHVWLLSHKSRPNRKFQTARNNRRRVASPSNTALAYFSARAWHQARITSTPPPYGSRRHSLSQDSVQPRGVPARGGQCPRWRSALSFIGSPERRRHAAGGHDSLGVPDRRVRRDISSQNQARSKKEFFFELFAYLG
jgi:hypothetical protein